MDKAFKDGIDAVHQGKNLDHVDHRNPNTFEVEDLAKLIKQVKRSCYSHTPDMYTLQQCVILRGERQPRPAAIEKGQLNFLISL